MRITLLSILTLAITLSAVPVTAQEQAPPIQAPETIEEAQEFGLQILQGIPGAIKEVWETQALPLWTKMWNIFLDFWNRYIFPWFQDISDSVRSLLGQEIEKRKPLIEEEFQKEKEELKQELKEKIPASSKTLWDRLKGFLPDGNE